MTQDMGTLPPSLHPSLPLFTPTLCAIWKIVSNYSDGLGFESSFISLLPGAFLPRAKGGEAYVILLPVARGESSRSLKIAASDAKPFFVKSVTTSLGYCLESCVVWVS